MRGLGLVLFLIGAPVHAQDLIYSNAATDACTRAGQTLPEQRACIGLSAAACMEATDAGYTTVGMKTCTNNELQYWDARLNAAYKRVRAEARRIDDGYKAEGITQPSLSETLLAAQRAWIAWRDTTCEFERAQWGYGTGGGPAVLSCHLHMTAEQALYLEFTRLEE